MIEFVSFTNQRNKEYQLATQIVSENGVKSVIKLPLCTEASGHISRIQKTLAQGLDTAHFTYVHSDDYKDGISFDFVAGETIEIYLNHLLEANALSEFKSFLTAFFQIYKGDFAGSLVPFRTSDAFAGWFGDPALTDCTDAARYTNIDITFDNLIMHNMSHFTVIDPEWVFDFPVPFEYSIYRTIRRYFGNSIDGKHTSSLSFEEMVQLSGIDPSAVHAFEEMDRHFNSKVFSTKIPRLQPAHSVLELMNQNSFASQVYLTDPPQETHSALYNIDTSEQTIKIEVASPDISTIRFDPIMTSGIIRIISCAGVTAQNEITALTYHSDAEVTAEDVLLFCHDDPKIYIEVDGLQIESIEITFLVLLTGESRTSVLSDQFDNLINRKNKLTQALEISEQKYRSLEDYLNSFLTRMTELETDNKALKQERDLYKVKYTNRTIKGAFLRIGRACKRVLRALLKKLGITQYSLIVQAIKHPSNILRVFGIIKRQGIGGLFRKIAGRKSKISKPTNEKVDKKLLEKLSTVISIIMPVYNVDAKWLDLAVKSVLNQSYRNWQLCIVDDASTNEETLSYLKSLTDKRILIQYQEMNTGISGASNEAAKMAAGEYIALMDNDDELHPNALYTLAKNINNSKADILYTDEDKVDVNGLHRFPFYKPDWSPDLLQAQMYIGHLFCFKRSLFEEVGGFDPAFNGAQDYDLAFRLTERSSNIVHIPKVMYSWREIPTSTAADPSAKPYSHLAGLRALDAHLKRKYGKNASAEETEYYFVYKPKFAVNEITTKVSIIIPMRDKIDLTRKCIHSILSKTSYTNYEIILVNNQSKEPETYEWFKVTSEKYPAVHVVDADCEFNWSKINNIGARQCAGSVLVFLNNDTEIISPDWLDTLAGNALRPDVGTVGALLLYEDGTIQHAGIVIGIGGWADHIFKGQKPVHFGSPFVSPVVIRNVSANTGACLAVSRKRFNELGGFDEKFIICGSDVELSIHASQLGYFNIFLPNVTLYHLESKSRDSYIPQNDYERSYKCYAPYRNNGDPFYNNNLSYENADVKQVKRPGDSHRGK
jgi:GT2 family glycosyltransferase